MLVLKIVLLVLGTGLVLGASGVVLLDWRKRLAESRANALADQYPHGPQRGP